MAEWSVKGKSIEDIQNLSPIDFLSLQGKELRETVSRLASAANKRLKRMEQSGETSPAKEKVERSGGKFSVAGKSDEQVRAEYLRAKMYLEDKTSSLRGWHTVQREATRKLEEKDQKRREETPGAPVTPSQDDYYDEGMVALFDAVGLLKPEKPKEKKEPPVIDEGIIRPGVWDYETLNQTQQGELWAIVAELMEEDPQYDSKAFAYVLFAEAADIKAHNKKMSYARIKSILSKRTETLYEQQQEGISGVGGLSSFFNFGPSE